MLLLKLQVKPVWLKEILINEFRLGKNQQESLISKKLQ